MTSLRFTKMQGSGNDFVVMQGHTAHVTSHKLIQKLCDRKYGVGADGVLLIEKSKKADVRMRIFNADGTEAEMCGNGARCAVLFERRKREEGRGKNKAESIKLETRAGVVESVVRGDNVKIKLTDPENMKLDVPININGRILKVNFINTGVPHVVIFVEGLKNIDVVLVGRQVRFHKHFEPRGTNVNFVEILNRDSVAVRTYERGVEDETLACGTGATASALITSVKCNGECVMEKNEIKVKTRSGEVLKVYFEKKDKSFKNVWLEGQAKVVYTGVYNV